MSSEGLVSTGGFPGKIQMLMGEGVYRLGTKELSCAFILLGFFWFFFLEALVCNILGQEDSLRVCWR